MLGPGDSIDIWVVEQALGSGGMGSVYRCHNRGARRILAAVKVLDKGMRELDDVAARFVREAEILFTLDHPNIVKVRNIRMDTDPPYIEMAFVEGESLESLLRRGLIPFERALGLMTQIADASAHLHEHGIWHRDIKPANLLVDDRGKITLVDFGLAIESDQARLTQEGLAFGTVSYAPPEWIRPSSLDPRLWDVYSLGVVFWELLTGKLAFPVSGKGSVRQQAMQVMVAKQDHTPLDPGPSFRGELRNLIRRMTQADPDLRLGRMDEVLQCLEGLKRLPTPAAGVTLAPMPLDEEVPSIEPAMRTEWAKALEGTPMPTGVQDRRDPVPSSDGGSGPLWIRRRRLVAWVAGGVFAAAAVVLGWVSLQGGDGRAPSVRRDVRVRVSGGGVPEQVLLGDTPGTLVEDGWSFEGIEPGESTLAWVQGEGCGSSECSVSGPCPEWCGRGRVPVTVEPGEGIQAVSLEVSAPPRRAVRVELPRVHEEVVRRGLLGGTDGVVVDGAVVFEDVPPGRRPLVLGFGDCPDDLSSCVEEDSCPERCIAWGREEVIPWGEEPLDLEVALSVPAPPANPLVRTSPPPHSGSKESPPGPPAAVPRSEPSDGTASDDGVASPGVVTVGEYRRWLETEPLWRRESAIAEGKADSSYLGGWDEKSANEPATGVSWYGAAAFCAGRGGLASVGAQPTTWTEGPNRPSLEYRVDAGKPAWRSSDGSQSTRTKMETSNDWTGFRCAR